MNRYLWTLTSLILLASCTSQAAVLQSGAAFGCKISPEKLQEDAARVCVGAIHQLEAGNVTIGGKPADARMVEDNSTRTTDISEAMEMPNGDVAAEVLCEINTRHHSVTYVRVTRGPTTQAQADFLRSQGACEE